MKKIKLILMIVVLLIGIVMFTPDVPAPLFCFNDGDCSIGSYCDFTGGVPGICVLGDPGECTGSLNCASGEYCDGDFICQDLPTCAEGNPGIGYNTQESNEDLWGDCSSSPICQNQYTVTTYSGLCSGSTYACASGSTGGIALGDVCLTGVGSVNPYSGTNCGTGAQACYCDNDWYQCDAALDVTYDQYFVGFTGTGTCISTGAVVRSSNVANPSGYVCDATSGVVQSYLTIMSFTAVCPTLTTDKFIIKNSVGTTCFEVDESGDALIYGDLESSCSTAPPTDSFIIKTASTVRGWVRDTDCKTCVYGSVTGGVTVNYAGNDGLYVKNAASNYVMKWDSVTGDLDFEGVACYDAPNTYSCGSFTQSYQCTGGTYLGTNSKSTMSECIDYCGGLGATCCEAYDEEDYWSCTARSGVSKTSGGGAESNAADCGGDIGGWTNV